LEGHPEPENGTFTGTYTSLVYWQDIVLTLRNYARQKYNKEIYITANGVFPFVDFQMIGLWGGNPDGPGGTSVNYCPHTADGHLDGTQSLLAAFMALKQRSARIDGRVVPVTAFIDWPTDVMTDYLSLPASVVVGEVGADVDKGPVLVTIEYAINPKRTAEFVDAMHEYGRTRRRDGAYRWAIFRDTEVADRYLELFLVNSWAEHLRQHERQTQADRELEGRIYSYLSGEPLVRHLIDTYATET
jgi:hypothetical protein